MIVLGTKTLQGLGNPNEATSSPRVQVLTYEVSPETIVKIHHTQTPDCRNLGTLELQWNGLCFFGFLPRSPAHPMEQRDIQKAVFRGWAGGYLRLPMACAGLLQSLHKICIGLKVKKVSREMSEDVVAAKEHQQWLS